MKRILVNNHYRKTSGAALWNTELSTLALLRECLNVVRMTVWLAGDKASERTRVVSARIAASRMCPPLKPHHPFHPCAVPHKLRVDGIGDVGGFSFSDGAVAFDVGADDERDAAGGAAGLTRTLSKELSSSAMSLGEVVKTVSPHTSAMAPRTSRGRWWKRTCLAQRYYDRFFIHIKLIHHLCDSVHTCAS